LHPTNFPHTFCSFHFLKKHVLYFFSYLNFFLNSIFGDGNESIIRMNLLKNALNNLIESTSTSSIVCLNLMFLSFFGEEKNKIIFRISRLRLLLQQLLYLPYIRTLNKNDMKICELISNKHRENFLNDLFHQFINLYI
jgi:hypothetical protein